MSKGATFVRMIAAGSLGVLLGCSDMGQPATAPDGVRAASSLLGTLTLIDDSIYVADGTIDTLASQLTTTLVSPVNRITPLLSDVSWSFTVGPKGVVSENTLTGLRITIPKRAVSSEVVITVTALAGAPVAYRFEPHGLVFSKKVHLSQDLLNLVLPAELTGSSLYAGYFTTDDVVLTDDGYVSVSEVIRARTNPSLLRTTFPITHFSGYILASGRDSTSDDQ